MQDFVFDQSDYQNKIATKNSNIFSILCFFAIILLGFAMFLYPVQKKSNFFFFVEVESFATYSQCLATSNELSLSGGAGYVYFDGNYKILAGIYSSEQDANNVVKNIEADYTHAKIYKVETKNFVNLKTLNQSQNKNISEIFTFLNKTINALTDLCAKYDKQVTSEDHIAIQLKNKKNECASLLENFSNAFKTNSTYYSAKKYLDNIVVSLNELSDFQNLSHKKSKIKFNTISIALNFVSFSSYF